MLSRQDLRYRFPSSTTTWSPFPQGKADGYRYLTVGLPYYKLSRNLIRVWVRQPAGKAYGYRSSLIFGIRYSFYSRVALLTPKALLFSVHCPLRPKAPAQPLFPNLFHFPFPSRSVRYLFLIFNFQLSIFNYISAPKVFL